MDGWMDRWLKMTATYWKVMMTQLISEPILQPYTGYRKPY